MLVKTIFTLLMVGCAATSQPTVYPDLSSSSNYSVDLLGADDNRQDTWGKSGVFTASIAFPQVPAGYRVRILRVYGNLTAVVKTALSTDETTPDRLKSGVLVGFLTNAGDGSPSCVPCADNTMLYLQGWVVGERATTLPFDTNVTVGGLLAPDNILRVRVATWLNTTGKPIHIEPSFTVVYHYEQELHKTQ